MAIRANITRRGALSTLAAAGAAGLAAPQAAAAETFDLQRWLDTAEPADVAKYHTMRLAEVMAELYPHRAYRILTDDDGAYVVAWGDLKKPEAAS